jgi:hypothetical protein
MVGRDPTRQPTRQAEQPDTGMLERAQVACLLVLLKEAVVQGRFVAVDAILHGLCGGDGGQGVNPDGLRWAAGHLAEELGTAKVEVATLEVAASDAAPVVGR